MYPFGHGLSYSDFSYSNFQFEGIVDDKIKLSLKVKNESNIDGEEVVQLYFRDSYSSVTRPVKELVRYKRISIKAGETNDVSFDVNIEDLAFYDFNMNLCVEPGEFEFMVGGTSENRHLIKQLVNIPNRYDF